MIDLTSSRLTEILNAADARDPVAGRHNTQTAALLSTLSILATLAWKHADDKELLEAAVNAHSRILDELAQHLEVDPADTASTFAAIAHDSIGLFTTARQQ